MLSLVEHPEETLRFLTALTGHLLSHGRRVAIDFSDVERVSSDALLMIRALMDWGKGKYLNVSGNMPRHPEAAGKIASSGFFVDFFRPPTGLPPPRGLMRRASDLIVKSEVAAELVDFALAHSTISGEVARASSQALVELMLNTNNHAKRAGASKKEHWHASVYCQDGVAYFTFVDLGVGLLNSAAPRDFLRRVGLWSVPTGRSNCLAGSFAAP